MTNPTYRMSERVAEIKAAVDALEVQIVEHDVRTALLEEHWNDGALELWLFTEYLDGFDLGVCADDTGEVELWSFSARNDNIAHWRLSSLLEPLWDVDRSADASTREAYLKAADKLAAMAEAIRAANI